jgi:glucose dehydrogenase
MPNTVAAIFGALYFITGVLGFIMTPGGGVFLGIFAVNWFHHLFHILLGGLGPLSAWRAKGRLYCQVSGAVLILLGVLGLIVPDLIVNLLAIPPADLFTDNLLHLVSGSALLYFGFASPQESTAENKQSGTLPR